MTVQKKEMVELVHRGDSDRAGDPAMRQSVKGDPLHAMYKSDDVKQEPERDRNQSQFLRSRVLRSQCLRRRTSGSCRTLQRNSLQRFSSSPNGFRFGTSHSTAQETRRTQAH